MEIAKEQKVSSGIRTVNQFVFNIGSETLITCQIPKNKTCLVALDTIVFKSEINRKGLCVYFQFTKFHHGIVTPTPLRNVVGNNII